MTQPAWHFLEQRPQDFTREAILDEFFSDQAIKGPANALVREVCQNSLDARHPDSKSPVVVRFQLADGEEAVNAIEASYWFDTMWDHLRARDCGTDDIPSRPPTCPFLLIEDFGTTGLTGDPLQWGRDSARSENRFFAFWRAEGVSEKQGPRGGRWGVGKVVLLRYSRYRLMAGLTVRSDDARRLLMGHTVLKYHEMDGKRFTPDGVFGIKSETNGLVAPIEVDSILDRFSRTFGLSRRTLDSGLSVVMPYPTDDITAKTLLVAALQEYFYAILKGRLVVRISGMGLPTGEVELNPDTYSEHLRQFGTELDAKLRPVMDLAIWAQTLLESERIQLNCQSDDGAPSWIGEVMSAEQLGLIAERFRRGERLALRAQVAVRQKGGTPQPSHLDIYIQRDLSERGSTPRFVRDGILVGGRERQVRGHRVHALIVAEEGPLATLLGDAEPPAHTHWDSRSEKFELKQYFKGKAFIEFVQAAPQKICELLSAHQNQRDRFSLADYFPRPPMEEESPVRPPKPTPDSGPDPEVVTVEAEPRLQSFKVEKISGGFLVRRGDLGVPMPACIEVKVAYLVRRGDPLKKYNPADFQLSNRPIRASMKGIREVSRKDNILLFVPQRDDFCVEIKGFDTNRDLFVRARATEVRDEQAV